MIWLFSVFVKHSCNSYINITPLNYIFLIFFYQITFDTSNIKLNKIKLFY